MGLRTWLGLKKTTPSNSDFDSRSYWNRRYEDGGYSGAGSYGRLAEFKAEVLNAFVREKNIGSVIEFGCGDGNQLGLAAYPSYLGFDVAQLCVDRCGSTFSGDESKAFRHYDNYAGERADLALSLDVVYHLNEDRVFDAYMERLFFAARRYCIVYSSNSEEVRNAHYAEHIRHRRFTKWVEERHPDFRLISHIPNKYPLKRNQAEESFADFYIFERLPASKHVLPGRLVLSLTSYAKRFHCLELSLLRLLQQTAQPDILVLWVSPEDNEKLPPGVVALEKHGLTIRLARDLGPFTKIIPALREHPDDFIITVDDDQIYPLELVEQLTRPYRSPKEILCRRAHEVALGANREILPYHQWHYEIQDQRDGADIFFTGVSGVLYPPRSLSEKVFDENAFTSLTPKADDVWLYWMALLNGCTVRRVGPPGRIVDWPGSQDGALWYENVANGGNDRQIAAMVKAYGLPLGLLAK